ncbi:transglutaminase-like cysteine peptidase [Asticcacaulis sp.]|uniref:transglutaminase-like cysteine peptidase n=1 Tax=Asticcacaulis sp. TaxID=1872648 RepID=UPI003F7B72F2
MTRINKYAKSHLLAFATITAALGGLYAGTGIAADRSSLQATFLPAGRQIAAPTAFLEMCSRSPEDCQQSAQPEAARIVSLARQAMVEKYELAFTHQIKDSAQDPVPGAVTPAQWPRLGANRQDNATPASAPAADYDRIDLDSDTMATLKAVNNRVNRTLIADTDARVYNVNDYWDAPALTPGARGDCEDFALIKRRLLIAQGIPAAALSLAIVRTRFNEDHAVLVVATKQGDFVLDNLAYRVRPWQKTGYYWVSRQAPGDDLAWVSLAPAPASTPAPAIHVAYNR